MNLQNIPTMSYDTLVSTLGYKDSPLFSEERSPEIVDVVNRHSVREAFDVGVRGVYFFKTQPHESPKDASIRPAVYIAEAETAEKAREIHRKLWNQGTTPFLIIVLPTQIRVYTGFAYHPDKPEIGEIIAPIDEPTGDIIAHALAMFHANAINRGEIWQSYASELTTENRVDTTLLAQLDRLGKKLQSPPHALSPNKAHALIGKFIYLSYLRARDILSDKWLESQNLVPNKLFNNSAFKKRITQKDFRALIQTTENHFNGQLFPIAWGVRTAPTANDIQLVATVFSGEEDIDGQMYFSFLAYDFSRIPVEFISTIYEQFLHETDEVTGKDAANPEKNGAYYTPEPLADYLAAELNTIRQIQPRMKVLDPCCGSGIFLVITYRRMVELECHRQGRATLPPSELRDLLVSSIFGVERNKMAGQIAVFSLILTLLNYVAPPELHRNKQFKFPTLSKGNIFIGQDFFDSGNTFWNRVSGGTKSFRFDWIIGNPPWVEIEVAKDPSKEDKKKRHFLTWYRKNQARYGLARYRTAEAFACRVLDCLALGGVAGLILQAKTLTNDQIVEWRKWFFSGVSVRRVSNLSNLKPVLFSSVKHPIITLVYTRKEPTVAEIVHVGPFLINQLVAGYDSPIRQGKQKQTRQDKSQSWVIALTETEFKRIPTSDAATGSATTWKMALWGTARDKLTIPRLRHFFPVTLGELAKNRGWEIAMGLQLRGNVGTDEDSNDKNPNAYEPLLEGKNIFDHKAFLKSGAKLIIPHDYMKKNTKGCFIRKRGGRNGLHIISGPRLFLWQDFAAYTSEPAIIEHSKVAISQGQEREMKAIATIWNSRFTSYFLFFSLSSEWGIGYNLIDTNDVHNMPFPEITRRQEDAFVDVWDKAKALEDGGYSFEDIRDYFDEQVGRILGIPKSTTLVVQEFFRFRYQLNNGKTPKELVNPPNESALKTYAICLRDSLDAHLGDGSHHKLRLIYSETAVSVSLSIMPALSDPVPVETIPASGVYGSTLQKLLDAAEIEFSQWVYVRKNMFVWDGDNIHLIKPARALEWTQTQALLDSTDVIAEITGHSRGICP